MNDILREFLERSGDNSNAVRPFGIWGLACERLQEAGLLVPIDADEMIYCDRCESRCMREIKRDNYRNALYHTCEDNPRYSRRKFNVDSALLRRWKPCTEKLMRRLGERLELLGACSELVPGVWKLGVRKSHSYFIVLKTCPSELKNVSKILAGENGAVIFTLTVKSAEVMEMMCSHTVLAVGEFAKLGFDGKVEFDIRGVREITDETTVREHEYEFRLRGQFRVVRFAGEECFFKDTLGLRYIEQLLLKPNQPIFVTDLKAIADGERPESLPGSQLYDNVTDSVTVKSLAKQYLELEFGYKNAIERGENLLAEETAEEMRKIMDYLKAAKGFGGKTKKAGDRLDAVRISVYQAIKRAISNIKSELPKCGEHLEKRISSGLLLNYSSEPQIVWYL